MFVNFLKLRKIRSNISQKSALAYWGDLSPKHGPGPKESEERKKKREEDRREFIRPRNKLSLVWESLTALSAVHTRGREHLWRDNSTSWRVQSQAQTQTRILRRSWGDSLYYIILLTARISTLLLEVLVYKTVRSLLPGHTFLLGISGT